MAYWVYSSEALPNTNWMGKSGYTPEIFMWGGLQLPIKAEWQKVQDTFFTRLRVLGSYDKPRREVVLMADTQDDDGKNIKGLAKVLRERWGERGVIILNHEPGATEKARLEEQSKKANTAFRMHVIENYEERLKQRAVGDIVPTKVTPYEDECYEVLGLTKPYSVEAMRAQRHPGEAVGEQIAGALERLLARQQSEKTPEQPAAK